MSHSQRPNSDRREKAQILWAFTVALGVALSGLYSLKTSSSMRFHRSDSASSEALTLQQRRHPFSPHRAPASRRVRPSFEEAEITESREHDSPGRSGLESPRDLQ